ncbi:hypothetical protein DLAC_01684 [Tieghemostelium lacteum]|uniref:Uncharacterized protein n=1 Tax=Tieghemostelium lacteum TaxID=361077 RepID=A0A152A615_TIELA|nr:hypothetical protein DLAC_01684 [Tieghemostelium lacteum]|eukprot:KYR01679.1 hypothetical protein DLAC_01684 [Tieghemostelium lacteum]
MISRFNLRNIFSRNLCQLNFTTNNVNRNLGLENVVVYRQEKMIPLEEQKKIFSEFIEKEGIKDLDQLYSVCTRRKVDTYTSMAKLFRYHSCSIYKMVTSAYPERQWDPWRFSKAPKEEWTKCISQENVSKAVLWFAKENAIKDLDAWYDVKILMFRRKCKIPRSIKKKELHQMIIKTYPKHRFYIWKFGYTPGIWDDIVVRKDYIIWILDKLKLKSLESLYTLPVSTLVLNHGRYLIQKYNKDMYQLLSETFPSYPWDKERFQNEYPTGRTKVNNNEDVDEDDDW